MVPSARRAPRPTAWFTWLVFAVLGLVATATGIFLPRSLRPLAETPAAANSIPPSPTTTAESKESLEYVPPALPDVPSSGSMFLRLTLGTVFVLILCALTLFAGKRWIRPLSGPLGENKQLRIVESLALGGRCAIYLIQAGETKVLAGVDGGGIKSLLPLPTSFTATLDEVED